MHLQIITPEKTVFDEEIEAVTLPGKDGEFQLLKNHAPIVATLAEGTVRIKATKENQKSSLAFSPDGKLLTFGIKGGILEMNNDKIMILANQ